MAEKKSLVWQYFDVLKNNNSKAGCKHCNCVLSRGKPDKPKDYSTSSLIAHLRSKHPDLYKEMTNLKSSVSLAADRAISGTVSTSAASDVPQSSHATQPSIKDAYEKLKVWDINSDNAKRIHLAIANMIVLDMEPYHVVQKPGFIELMKTLDSGTEIQHAIPQIFH